MGFQLVLKAVASNDLEQHNVDYFALFYQNLAPLGASYVKVVEDRPILLVTKMSKESGFSNI